MKRQISNGWLHKYFKNTVKVFLLSKYGRFYDVIKKPTYSPMLAENENS